MIYFDQSRLSIFYNDIGDLDMVVLCEVLKSNEPSKNSPEANKLHWVDYGTPIPLVSPTNLNRNRYNRALAIFLIF